MIYKKKSIFISHTHSDKLFAERIALDISDYDINVWIDEAEIKLGDSLIQKIREGIDNVDYLAVILSPESIKSEWVKKEVDIAMNQEIKGKRVKVLPLMFKKCNLPWFLEGKFYADFTNPNEYNKALSLILNKLGFNNNYFNSKSEIIDVIIEEAKISHTFQQFAFELLTHSLKPLIYKNMHPKALEDKLNESWGLAYSIFRNELSNKMIESITNQKIIEKFENIKLNPKLDVKSRLSIIKKLHIQSIELINYIIKTYNELNKSFSGIGESLEGKLKELEQSCQMLIHNTQNSSIESENLLVIIYRN